MRPSLAGHLEAGPKARGRRGALGDKRGPSSAPADWVREKYLVTSRNLITTITTTTFFKLFELTGETGGGRAKTRKFSALTPFKVLYSREATEAKR